MVISHKRESYPFINDCLDHDPSCVDLSSCTLNGDFDRIARFETWILIRDLDSSHIGGSLDLVDLRASGTSCWRRESETRKKDQRAKRSEEEEARSKANEERRRS